MAKAEPIELVYSLVGFPSETEWIEFKEKSRDPKKLGEDISALANSAAYLGKEYAYRIWGVSDDTHELVGTGFDYLKAKAHGNQGLLIWLKQHVSLNANYQFDQFDHDGKHFVTLRISAAVDQPVTFDNAAFIREGSSTTRLAPGSAREAELWRRLQRTRFEERVAEEDVPLADIPELLDVYAYFDLLGGRNPSSVEGIVAPMCELGLLRAQGNGRFSITNLGALLIARKMTAFHGMEKRALRVVRFVGDGNFDIVEDRSFDSGYAMALSQAKDFILSYVPAEEVVEGAFRRIVKAYPEAAVRELVANSVIHQDLAVTSAGPQVDVYDSRIVFRNPGSSLIPVGRVLNAQPRTRNVALAGLLSRMDLCEEGGTGWDRAVAACEAVHMLAPKMESDDELGTTVTLFKGAGFERMTRSERLDCLYWHACLMYAQGGSMSNATLRERFGLDGEGKNSLAVSRLIKQALDEHLVKVEDEKAGSRYKRYIPAWA